MSEHFSTRDQEIRAVFARALPFIDSTLLSQYKLPRDEATEMEQRLSEWFETFSRRPGTPVPIGSLRSHLLLMTCQAGHVYWAGKLGSETPADENVKRALTLGPQEIAIELEKSFEEKEKEKKRQREQEKGKEGDEKEKDS